MMRRVWTSLALTVALLLLVGIGLASGKEVPSGPPEVAQPLQPEEATNTLRVYGREDENAAFPYATFDGPFNLKSPEAPPKDFVVFNPALLRDDDDDAHGQFGDFFNYFKVDGVNFHEKVHARMWYVPEYEQPAGETEPEVESTTTTADIVFEYTYMMLDHTTLDPVHGASVDMAFPIAGWDPDDPTDPPGLDSYDIDIGQYPEPEIMSIDAVNPTYDNQGTYAGLAVSAKRTAGSGVGQLREGDRITFFDYMVEVLDEPTTEERKVRLGFYYVGYGYDAAPKWCGSATLWDGDFATVEARFGPVNLNGTPSYVDEPFWVTVDTIGIGYVKLTPHRLLREAESFFVDGAEYDVAKIFLIDDTEGSLFKYITIRNPIPKGEGEVLIDDMTVYKERLPAGESMWMLPPFSYQHDMVDDINIPKWFQELEDDVRTNYCDFDVSQLPDNLDDDDDMDGEESFIGNDDREGADDTPVFDDECNFITWEPEPDGYGDVSFLSFDYNSILDRLVEDVGPLDGENLIAWTEQTKEERFDTNLLEEKFEEDTANNEWWEWINVETRPYTYTEFILPPLPDAPTEAGYDRGDFLLVGSWRTQDGMRMAFDFDAEQSEVDSADIYVNDAEYNDMIGRGEVNSLRVYGRCDENAPFPYEEYWGPFSIDSDQTPPKDFVVFNPAYLHHEDDDLFGEIKADADANEKVHLRMWYVPKYLEPAGLTCPEVLTDDKVSNWESVGKGDIVLEYTYLLLDDTTNDPTHGGAEKTRMVFPMAGSQIGDLGGVDPSDPIGLDSYDVDADGNDDIMSLEYVSETLDAVVFSPRPVSGDITLEVGDAIEFLDFMVELEGTATQETKADLNIYYTGRAKDAPTLIDSVTLWQGGGPLPAGDTAALVGPSTGVVSTTVWTVGDFSFNGLAEPVCAPFIIYVDYAGIGEATIHVYRWLQEGETIFVDGAEYDISEIFLVEDGEDWELKYISVRNPIPKGEGRLLIGYLTVWKSRVAAGEILPVLPPFDREHDMIDDVNVYDCVEDEPDQQYVDNFGEDCDGEDCEGGVCTPEVCCAPDYLHEDYDTIEERRIEDVEALEFYWLAEEKEVRFDTNLLEEKFTIAETDPYTQTWQWINIETMPWDFTEFVLPPLPDIGADNPDLDERWKTGDYLLVSSFLTEDSYQSDSLESSQNGVGPVRMKFAYDPEDGTGLYVNSIGPPCDPVTITSLTSNSPVEFGEIMTFTAVVTGTEPFTYTWDFGGAATATGEDTATPTFDYDEPGDYTVVFTATNPCGEAVDSLDVEVECDPVQIVLLDSNSPVLEGEVMQFSASGTGTGPFTYEWDFGGAGTPTNENTTSPSYLYDDPVEYTVVFTVTNPCGVDSQSLEVEVMTCIPVEIESLTSDSPVPVGSPMHFDASVTGTDPITYTWNFGGAGTASGEDTANPTYTYDHAGTYDVTLIVENACGEDEETLEVHVADSYMYLPLVLRDYATCYDPIVNGGFELSTGWTIPNTVYPAGYTTNQAHSGSRSMRVGIEEPFYNVFSYSSANQTVDIPAEVGSATLRFYLYPFSGATPLTAALTGPPDELTIQGGGSFFGDMQYVYVYDEFDQQIGEPLILDLSDSREWTLYEFDLGQPPYLGKTIKLIFGAFNDGCCGVTGMYVDDVSLEICE